MVEVNPVFVGRLAVRILSAYRQGEMDMRERCAELAELYRRTSIYGSADATNMAATIGKRLRALPLTEDSNEQAVTTRPAEVER